MTVIRRQFGANRRGAFTLVELLVVMAIIAILMALAAWGTFAMIGSRQSRNTELSMLVINKALQSHWRYVVDEAKKDTVSPAVLNLAGNDGERARVLWIKFRLAEAFPQSFAEIGTPSVPPFVYTSNSSGQQYIPLAQRRYISAYQAKIANRIVANTDPKCESAACLLMALSVSRGGNALTRDDINYAVADTNGDNVPEFVDGWGTPLKFIRFATGATMSNGLSPNPAAAGTRSAKFADPVDPNGTLLNLAWYGPPVPNNRTAIFEPNFHPVSATPGSALYVLPIIVSAGKDGIPAVNPDGSRAGPGADDIFSFELRGD